MYTTIENLICNKIGFTKESIGKNNIERAIKLRMAENNILVQKDYYDLVISSEYEFQKLVEMVVIPETWFFRDEEPFIFLKSFVNNNWRIKNYRSQLNVLSAPCSTGEEPYSIAITLFESGLDKNEFLIDAIDINSTLIEKAKEGLFNKHSFRNQFSDFRENYFTHNGNGFLLSDKIRSAVNFSQANLISNFVKASNLKYDVIFCRNLIIYLSPSGRKNVLANINNLLADDGVVFTGHAELMFFIENNFKPIPHPRSFACIKKTSADEKTITKESKTHLKSETKNHKVIRTTKNVSKPKNLLSNLNSIVSQSENHFEEIQKFADQGNFLQSKKLCEEFLISNPTNIEANFLMGLLLENLNKESMAEEFYNKVLYLDPNHYETLMHLSILYERRGNSNRALIFKNRLKRIITNNR